MRLSAGLCGIVTAVAIVGMACGQEKPGSGPSVGAPREPDLQEKIDVYVRQLKHGGVEQRREAALALGRIAERAKAAVPSLTEGLQCEDRVLRVAAAEALWQANKDPVAVTALVKVIKDKVDEYDWAARSDFHGRSIAVEALDRIGPEARAAVPALLAALEEGWVWERADATWLSSLSVGAGCCSSGRGRPIVRLSPGSAAYLLWRIDKHPSVMPALINALKDPTHRPGAALALGRIGVDAKDAVPALLKVLRDENGKARYEVARALWQINKHPAYITLLAEGLKDKQRRDVCIGYVLTLGDIGAEARAAVPALAEALKDERDFVGMYAAGALGRIGADAAVPALLEALKDRGRVRVYAAEALWRINKHPDAVPALAEALKGMAEVDYSTHYALRRIGIGAKAALPVLVEGLKDKSVQRRVEVALTLWKIDENPAVVPVLVDVLQDPNANGYLRMSAAKALWQISKHPGVVPALVGVLKDKNDLLRPQAAEALWQINRHPATVPALLEALKHRDNWVSGAAARALGRIGAEATVAKAALTEALQDEDEGVRASAGQWLRRIDPEAAKKAGVG